MKYLIAGLILISLSIPAAALDTCVPGKLKVAVLRGRVITAPTQVGIEPIANVAVELRKGSYSGPLVARVVTSQDGRFDFGRVPNGKYVIIVDAPPGLSGFSFPIQFKNAPASKNDEPEMSITVGFGYKGCHGSYAQYKDARTN
jgi:hypothetical protein